MIVALVAQDNCLTFAKSVSVSLAYSISLHLKALCNFGILQRSVTQTEFAMGIDKQNVWQHSKQEAAFFYYRNNHSFFHQSIWSQNDRCIKSYVLHASTYTLQCLRFILYSVFDRGDILHFKNIILLQGRPTVEILTYFYNFSFALSQHFISTAS